MLNSELSERGKRVDSGSESAFAAGALYAARLKQNVEASIGELEAHNIAAHLADVAAVRSLSSKQMGLKPKEAKELVRLARKESNETDPVRFVGVCLRTYQGLKER